MVQITPLLRLLLTRLTSPELSASSRGLTEKMVLDVIEPAPREITVTIPSAPLLQPIVEALRDDPGDRHSLGDWSRTLGVSTKTLTRVFRFETGLSFTRWVAAVRAQDAIYLLGRGTPLEEVAMLLGYSSPSAFGAAIKRVTGSTPSTFQAVAGQHS
ncbi:MULTISPECIES: helix-turn-helix domain-containing protein [Microbacterium]|uniref:helix-turn-helix domain-containing protein n=1 Tax=Microbacterium TaxID=33882 RepID=UPI001D825569|nr:MULTISPECIES: AraC family transcriptional regulator [Microbacterium]CAH0177521.1 HTH-type transcriptional regulator RipA [Microbacterium sp. Bi128]